MTRSVKTAGRPATVSMTGFGRASLKSRAVQIDVEIKSVNNRYIDISIRLPKEYSALEQQLRKEITGSVQRGRIEIGISRRVSEGALPVAKVDLTALDSLMARYRSAGRRFGIADSSFMKDALLDILSRKEVMESVVDQDTVQPAEVKLLTRTLRQAMKELVSSRMSEGRKLGQDIAAKLEDLSKARLQIEKRAKSVPQRYQSRLSSRVKELATGHAVDEQRLAAEVALMADRCDISEELVRLGVHIDEACAALSRKGTGRRLDFLLQEFTRELNTMSSKAADAEISGIVVDCKSIVEKIREQVQNLE
ncbi:MAG: YicC family protein [Deltaproteobacteria bacterium]|nr:YicC family protein [Deltaproteobacteria bacterium]